jgi:hypothetical protein
MPEKLKELEEFKNKILSLHEKSKFITSFYGYGN